jgi:hypothetical protein
VAGTSILVETAMPGRPLWAELDSRSYDELARLGTSWLIAFANATKKPAADVTMLATRLLGEFETRFGACFDDATMRAAERCLRDIGPLPRVSEQRDFGPWNLLLSAHRSFGVLDWESAELEGLPAADLTYFLSYLAFFELRALRNGRFVDIHRLSLDPSTRWGSTRERCLLQYADGTGIDPRALRHIPLLTWMIHSRSEHRRLVEDVGTDPGLEALRKCVFPRLWELELGKVLQA